MLNVFYLKKKSYRHICLKNFLKKYKTTELQVSGGSELKLNV